MSSPIVTPQPTTDVRRPQRFSRGRPGDPRWRQLAGAGLPRGRAARRASWRAARGLAHRRRRQPLRRPHLLVGPDDPRPCAPGRAAGRERGCGTRLLVRHALRERGAPRRGDRRPRWSPSTRSASSTRGTEATMSAIRLARGFTGRDVIVKFAGCYHGHVDALLASAGSGVATFALPDSAGVPRSSAGETIVLPYNDLPAVEAAFAERGQRDRGRHHRGRAGQHGGRSAGARLHRGAAPRHRAITARCSSPTR